MRTLEEIVGAARTNEELTAEESRYAIVAFDVLLAQMALEHDAVRLKKWFIAAESDPRVFVGEANDPQNAEAVAWYRAMIGVGGA